MKVMGSLNTIPSCWDTSAVRNYIDEFNVPYNPLHDKGFVSIGCAPAPGCKGRGRLSRRQVVVEDSSKKECGLHVSEAPVTEVRGDSGIEQGSAVNNNSGSREIRPGKKPVNINQKIMSSNKTNNEALPSSPSGARSLDYLDHLESEAIHSSGK